MERIDESVAKRAAQSIQEQAPDLSWVYLEYTDDMGHMYGDSPEFERAVALADQKIGYVLASHPISGNSISTRTGCSLSLPIMAATLRRVEAHGGQSDRERSSWMFTNAKDLNDEFQSATRFNRGHHADDGSLSRREVIKSSPV